MTSFVKHIAVLAAALIATTALGEKADDPKSSKPDAKDSSTKDPKDAGGKKSKKSKGSKSGDESADSTKKPLEIPVPMGHDSKGLHIPYFDGSGKREMDFLIGVASRIDQTHVRMTNMQVETYNDEGKHDLTINLPTSVYDSEKSAIVTDQHVTITRDDFVLHGETMIFYTIPKQGGLGGGVRMLIYNLKEETDADQADNNGKAAADKESKPQNVDPRMKPDGFKTPPSRANSAASKPDKLTPLR